MIKVKGYFKGTTKGNTINPIFLKHIGQIQVERK